MGSPVDVVVDDDDVVVVVDDVVDGGGFRESRRMGERKERKMESCGD